MDDIRKLKLEELERIDVDAFKSRAKIPVVVVLDNLRSGLNVGSFFRSSDAFAVDHIYLTGISPVPPHKEILKSAIGATRSMSWSYTEKVEDALNQLHADGYSLVGIEQTTASVEISDFAIDPKQRYAIIFGNEVEGLSEETLKGLDVAIELPQFGTKHSLNVSVCGGIVIWEFMKAFQNHLQ